MLLDDFTGFQWNGKHTSELGLVVVSSGGRYDANTLTNIQNNVSEMPGGVGDYYFNQTFKSKTITINFAFDTITEEQRREIRNWLAYGELSDLVFDECPYKAYGAKIDGKPSFKFLCFDEPDKTKEPINGKYPIKRVYKGEGTINFYIPFPFAYTARAHDGTYMKYLDQLEYYKDSSYENLSNPKLLKTITVGYPNSLSIQDKSVVQLLRVAGNTINLNQDGEWVFSRMYIDKNNKFSILNKNKVWVDFYTDTEEKVYLDAIDNTDYVDTIEFVPDTSTNLEKGSYKLIKRTGSITITPNDIINNEIKLSNVLKDKIVNLPFQENMFGDFENLGFSLQGYQFIGRPQADNIGSNNFYLKDSRVSVIDLKRYPETLVLGSNTQENITLIYPLREPIEIPLSTSLSNNSKILEENTKSDLLFSIEVKTTNGDKIQQNLTFRVLPVLYKNLNEWSQSSGLEPNKTINGETYDIYSNYGEAVGFKVKNNGDMDTPFRIRIPLNQIKVNSESKELAFVLQQGQESIDYSPAELIESIADLEVNKVYAVRNKDTEESLEFDKFYVGSKNNDITKLSFLTIDGQEVVYDGLQKDFYRIKESNTINKVISSFVLDFSSAAIPNSFIKIFENQYTDNSRKTNTFLEIDSYKQTLNFIIQSTKTRQETIIPVYFLLTKGELFKIPPKLDNLYLLVYDKRKKETSNNQIIHEGYYLEDGSMHIIDDIDYKYLYY